MTHWYRVLSCVVPTAVISVSLAGPSWAEFLPPDPLDRLWEQHMLEGAPSAVGVTIKDSKISVSETWPKKLLDRVKNDSPLMLYLEPYGINLQQRGEGVWGNGGWSLLGGLLDEVSVGPSRIQLYAKIVQHHHSFFPVPFLFHRDHPVDSGYEFFLLHRKEGLAGAKIINTWVFPPNEVVLKDVGHGGAYPDVRASFRYDSSSHMATVSFMGLKNSIQERLDLTSELEGISQLDNRENNRRW